MRALSPPWPRQPNTTPDGLRVRTGLILWGAVALLLLAAAASRADDGRPPNVVLIMADDLGYECLGCNGGTSYRTPHLDTLARGGLRFTSCHAQPLCTPSRVQLMTGLYNQRNYLRFGVLDPRATTFAQVLKKAGYATCVAGKWQLGGGFQGPGHFGFDEYCLWQLTRRPGRYPNPGLEINGKEVDFTRGEYGPDVVSDYLCDFIRRHRDRPFLAYYPMLLPHWPFEPTPASESWDPKALGVLKGQGNTKYFADMVAYTDRMVGKVVRQLDELGLRERTLILFTGDNGTATSITSRMGEQLVQGGKGLTTDAGTHVPLIASWPGVTPAGQVCDSLVDFTDFFPTLLQATGARAPAEPKLDGQSFLPQLRGEKGEPRQWIYCWYARDGGPRGVELARNHRFKLYAGGRMYDVQADPLEKHNLSASRPLPAEAREARARLRKVLDRFAGSRRPAPGSP